MTTARAAATFDRMLVGRQSGATQPSSTQPSDDRFVHEAMFYRTASELLAGTVGFVEQGLAAGEPVLVVAPAPTLSRLTDALPFSIDRVTLLDMSEAGRNPGRIIPMVLLAFADAHPGQRVRIIAEPIWPGRTGLEYPACLQHEALINTAFASRSATIRCPYDAASLSPSQLDDAAPTPTHG